MAAGDAVAAELVMRCFAARTAAHALHLGTRSYAKHMALGDFYGGIGDLADSFAEAYQGVYGLLKLPTGGGYDQSKDYKDGIGLLAELRGWIQAKRRDIGSEKDTELQNLIDEIVGLIDGTAYKLRFLG